MGIIEHTIDVFEKRVSDLDKIIYGPNLPQWTDADVIAASCLITEYRNLTRRRSRAANACACFKWFPEDKGESCHVPGCGHYPPPA